MAIKVSGEALIVGPDHQNTLGVIRALGANGVTPHVMIVSDEPFDRIKCFKSRYALGKKLLIPNNEAALLEALKAFGKEKAERKLPIFPTDDFAEFVIDSNLNLLSETFSLPGFAGEQGKICELMSKARQYTVISEMGLSMAKTRFISLRGKPEKAAWDFPVILKPDVSAFGSKGDIAVAENEAEYRAAVENYQKTGYDSVLVQEFIKKDYELCTFGCIAGNSKSVSFGTLKKLRYYPYTGGASLSYAQFTDTPKEVRAVIDWMKEKGYSGLFDIESFFVGGKVLINEMNFRNSGNTWALVHAGINAPLIWYQDVTREKVSEDREQKNHTYFMNETADSHHLRDRKISPAAWLRDLLRTKSFNKFWIKDLKGSMAWYLK